MKNFLILCALVSSFTVANAQSKNDPTYSIHNYKQPNKAAEAPLIKKEGVDNEVYVAEENVANRNYKASDRTLEHNGAAMPAAPVETRTNSLASNGNYKSAFGKNKGSEPSKEQNNYSAPVVKIKEHKSKNN